ncbi:MAG: hypothetical protein R2705_00340 [Ilumatobacteraceae bacterium]
MSSRTVAPALQVDACRPDWWTCGQETPCGPCSRGPDRSTGAHHLREAPLDARFESGARHWLAGQGVPDGPLVAVCGAMDGVERVLAAHLRPGGAIAVEDPGYPSVVHVALARWGSASCPFASTAGMVPEELARSSVRSQAVVVTPRPEPDRRCAHCGASGSTHRHLGRTRPTYWSCTTITPVTCPVSRSSWSVPATDPVDRGRWSTPSPRRSRPDWRIAVVTGDDVTVDRVDQRFRVGPGWVSHRLQRAIGQALTDPARRAESSEPRRVMRSADVPW